MIVTCLLHINYDMKIVQHTFASHLLVCVRHSSADCMVLLSAHLLKLHFSRKRKGKCQT